MKNGIYINKDGNNCRYDLFILSIHICISSLGTYTYRNRNGFFYIFY